MKKIAVIVATLVMVLVLASCSDDASMGHMLSIKVTEKARDCDFYRVTVETENQVVSYETPNSVLPSTLMLRVPQADSVVKVESVKGESVVAFGISNVLSDAESVTVSLNN